MSECVKCRKPLWQSSLDGHDITCGLRWGRYHCTCGKRPADAPKQKETRDE